MKPLLLLDIDGTLSPFSEQPGYEMVGVTWVSKTNADRLARLKEHYDLVWATSWEDDANGWFSEYHDLPPLPVIYFASKFPEYENKLGEIMEYVGLRPFAWIDDVIGWQAEEFAAHHTAALLIRTDPMVGLTDDDVVKLLDFAKEASDEASTVS